MNQLLHESNAADRTTDLLDLVFERANPNTERQDCPTASVDTQNRPLIDTSKPAIS